MIVFSTLELLLCEIDLSVLRISFIVEHLISVVIHSNNDPLISFCLQRSCQDAWMRA